MSYSLSHFHQHLAVPSLEKGRVRRSLSLANDAPTSASVRPSDASSPSRPEIRGFSRQAYPGALLRGRPDTLFFPPGRLADVRYESREVRRSIARRIQSFSTRLAQGSVSFTTFSGIVLLALRAALSDTIPGANSQRYHPANGEKVGN